MTEERKPIQLTKDKNQPIYPKTMDAWLIRSRINDADGVCIAYRPPRTVPPDLGRKLLRKYPLDWEVVDRHFQVPYGPRVPRGGQMKEDSRISALAMGSAMAPGPGETTKRADGVKVNYK